MSFGDFPISSLIIFTPQFFLEERQYGPVSSPGKISGQIGGYSDQLLKREKTFCAFIQLLRFTPYMPCRAPFTRFVHLPPYIWHHKKSEKMSENDLQTPSQMGKNGGFAGVARARACARARARVRINFYFLFNY